MEELIDKCKEDELEFFATLVRGLWFRRNKVVYGGEFTPPNILIQEVAKAHQDFSMANKKDGIAKSFQRSFELLHWHPPQEDIYKVNWDAALDFANRRMAIGILVRNHLGM